MYKILLVEDERETANFVKQALELEDMEVETAYDGQEGLDLFRANEYDLLLLRGPGTAGPQGKTLY